MIATTPRSMAQVGAGAGGERVNDGWQGMERVLSIFTIFRVRLGDGITRVKAGERLEHTKKLFGQRETTDEDTPAHPRNLAPSKEWKTVQDLDEFVVEERTVYGNSLEETVVVFFEGIALPTRELLSVVNTAHAVLVLRGNKDYFYLNADFVLSADGERALMEWGVGRPMFANSLLAVGGTLLVAFAERVWAPLIVGTLLVAAAGYRVQGALTKVLRARSDDWKAEQNKFKLVPSGILGAERVVQGALVILVSLADLLDDRWLLMAALTLASVQVIALEYLGQACLTWGFAKYHRTLREQLLVWTSICWGLVGGMWFSYVFGAVLVSLGVSISLISIEYLRHESDDGISRTTLSLLISVGAVIFAVAGVWETVVGWDDADLKNSWQSLLLWRWPLFRKPDSFFQFLMIVGHWLGAVVTCGLAAIVVVWVFSYKIGDEREEIGGVDERTLAREKDRRGNSPGFSHYDEKPIPSRNLLVPEEVQQAPDVGQQTLDYFWGDVGVGQQAPDVGQQTPDVGQQPAPFSSAV